MPVVALVLVVTGLGLVGARAVEAGSVGSTLDWPGRGAAPPDANAWPARRRSALRRRQSRRRPPASLPARCRPIFAISPVSSNEDLLEVLATAPRRSVIVLADDGPYRLGGRTWSSRSTAPLANHDLTIKAEPGVRPLIKFATDARLADRPQKSLLRFVGGHVTIEGLKFELDAVLPDELVTAIRTEDTELTVRGCSFRRTNSREGRNVAAIQVRTVRPLAAGDRPPAVLADSCHFDGGQTGILAEGPVDVVLRDCTMGPGQPSIWFDNARSNIPVFSELRLKHSSIMAGSEPVFRFDGTQARVWVDDSVVAPAGRSPATLVMVDNSRNLAWRGRSNLYSGIGVYLAISTRDDRQESINDFARWSETPTELRETGTSLTANPVWETDRPGSSPAGRNRQSHARIPHERGQHFAVRPGSSPGPVRVGLEECANRRKAIQARRVARVRTPRGTSREQIARQDARAGRIQQTVDSRRRAPRRTRSGRCRSLRCRRPTLRSRPPPTIPWTSPRCRRWRPPGNRPKIPVRPAPAPAVRRPGPVIRGRRATAARDAGELARNDRDRRPAFEDEDVIRSSEQFMTMFNRLGRQGGKLRIAAGADLDLSSILIDGSGRYQIAAEPGSAARRPRLRFRASADTRKAPADWTVMLNLRSGSLHVQGIDLVVPDQEIAASR